MPFSEIDELMISAADAVVVQTYSAIEHVLLAIQMHTHFLYRMISVVTYFRRNEDLYTSHLAKQLFSGVLEFLHGVIYNQSELNKKLLIDFGEILKLN